ncbi:MAG: hypothetical protein KGZ49_06670 [Syntrophaceae bacterium]|nr:hypothetical protein [Syntrophaceae bacterium]
MSSPFDRFKGITIFDDKGEVKRMAENVVQEIDPDVIIDRMRKLDFSYVFILSKKEKSKEVELGRSEIEASQEWRKGNIDPTLQKKIKNTIAEL